jgi:hypothetical protein
MDAKKKGRIAAAFSIPIIFVLIIPVLIIYDQFGPLGRIRSKAGIKYSAIVDLLGLQPDLEPVVSFADHIIHHRCHVHVRYVEER